MLSGFFAIRAHKNGDETPIEMTRTRIPEMTELDVVALMNGSKKFIDVNIKAKRIMPLIPVNFKYDLRSFQHFESALLNYYYAYKLSKIKNIVRFQYLINEFFNDANY